MPNRNRMTRRKMQIVAYQAMAMALNRIQPMVEKMADENAEDIWWDDTRNAVNLSLKFQAEYAPKEPVKFTVAVRVRGL